MLRLLCGENAIQNDFVRSLGSIGVPFLADYAALWLLGLGMVQTMDNRQQQQQKMKLFISRGSNCTMEALSTYGQSLATQPAAVHLTNGTDGVKLLKFRATKQCQANKGTDEATKKQPFGIQFRLPKDAGNCDDE
ncbi:hypothetical protein niasHT_002227 [Heterodera trifolii]|uniref:Uncharacterized protein n=1 Tax=Heterodera trifolii TaxID=157864 RepID=A0ABD2LUZ1_9BILA